MSGYKIKDLETLTGIKAHTIRIWEKRYGLITPDRTESLIRTYTNNELILLLNISLLNKNGYKISKIASLEEDEIAQKVWALNTNNTIDSSTEKLILALVKLDESLFKNTLQEVIESVGLERAFVDHLIQFLDRIGIMWLVGTISIVQEHFISNLVRQKIISEIDKLEIPKSIQPPVMLYLPENEWHEISLLFYQFILRKNGVPTIYLGQSLPYDSLIECIIEQKPRALITSWLTSVDKKTIINYFEKLSKDSVNCMLYAGGYQIKVHGSFLKKYVKAIHSVNDLDDLVN
jgi:DNA-binding transcriptional MerR regulator